MRRVGLLLLTLFTASTSQATQVELGGGIEYFQWHEYADNGRELVSESGPRYFVEVKGTKRVERRWWQDFSCRIYSGTVKYDGETIPDTTHPVASDVTLDTNYSGIRADVGFSYLTKSSRSEPDDGDWLVRFGLGVESWRRGILDGTADAGWAVSGYSERYIVSYVTVAGQYLGSGWRGGVGIMAPYYVDEEASFLSGTSLHPVGQLSPFANVEFYMAAQWSLVLEYETYRFAKSDVSGGYYQPKSNRDSYSAFIRYHF